MYIVIDTETGGLTTDHSLLSVAGIVCDDQLNEISHFELFVRPENVSDYIVSDGALAINKIDIQKHAEIALTYATVDYALSNHAKCTPVGWNVPFDVGFIKRYLPEFAKRLHYRALDVQSVAQFMALKTGITGDGGGSLSHWAKRFNIPTDGAHGALFDCYMTLNVLRALKDL